MSRKVAILELVKLFKDSSIAHIRIARFLKNTIQDSFFINSIEDIKRHFNDEFTDIVIMYASKFFWNGPFSYIERFLDNQKKAKLHWCINEYDLSPNSYILKLFKQRGVSIIANFERDTFFSLNSSFEKIVQGFKKINLNVTAFREDARPLKSKLRQYDLIYWGTFRPDRSKYFTKHLKDCIVSSSKKNIPKFKKVVKPKFFIDKLSWLNGYCPIRNFKYSLYIEDEFTHKNFNHLADRFYESLSYDLVTLFDVSCRESVNKSGYKISDNCFIDKIDLSELNFEDLLLNNNYLKQQFVSEKKQVKEDIKKYFS